MIATVVRAALWLGAGHALAALAVLGFLYTPESNVLMLVTSALLVMVTAGFLLLSSTSAAVALVHRQPAWRAVRPALRRVPLVLFGIVVIGLLCGGAGWFESWWMARAGEVDAAAIAVGDVTHTRPLHQAVRWAVVAIQWVFVPAWLATCLAWAAAYDRRDVLSLKWLTAGMHWRVLAVTAIGVALLVWLPWRYVYWRPRGLPASSVELAFVGAKLIVIYGLAQLAWAATLSAAAMRVTPPGVVGPPPPAVTPQQA